MRILHRNFGNLFRVFLNLAFAVKIGTAENSVRSFTVIWDIPILRKPPVRLAQPGVNGSANKNNPVKGCPLLWGNP